MSLSCDLHHQFISPFSRDIHTFGHKLLYMSDGMFWLLLMYAWEEHSAAYYFLISTLLTDPANSTPGLRESRANWISLDRLELVFGSYLSFFL